jgi:5'-nucleotidase / UDP-sugar diphosphatase
MQCTSLFRSVSIVSAAFLCIAAGTAQAQSAPASLTLLHNNDGESKLLGSGGFGGIGYFSTVVATARADAASAGRDVLFVSSGDNILAGLAFTASVRAGQFYDAIALARLNYDAITLGNHDFDFGPDVLGDIIDQYESAGGTARFVSANLDVSAEPNLAVYATSGRIARSVVITRGTQQYGVIGVTTETLPSVSSPRDVVVSDTLAAIQAEVAALTARGVNKIILSSHLQGVSNELALVPQLRGVDIIIAGGGDEYLINPGTGGDRYSDTLDGVNNTPDNGFERRFGPYPLATATDADGRVVPIVTTVGEYRYLGKLDVDFDAAGNVLAFNGNPILVDPLAPGATQDAVLVTTVIDPLVAAQNELSLNVIGTTEVPLNGRRGQVQVVGGAPVATITGVRNAETNEGNLIADAFAYQTVAAPANGLTPGARAIVLTNGGGIRNDNIVPVGPLSERTTIDILPFDNYVSVINGITPLALRDMLENAVARWEAGDGRFAQIAGFRFEWDPRRPPTVFSTAARTMDDVTSTGQRVRRIEFDDGTLIYDAATGSTFAGTFDLITNSFVAGGGDGYDFAGNNNNDLPGTPALPRTNLPFSYQQALFNYIFFGLPGNSVRASEYPVAGQGRIIVRGDVDGDGDIDSADVAAITAARNQPALAPVDRRDMNRDGRIDVLDARLAAVNCSRARCAAN